MKGDFSRLTHDPFKHFTGVLKQQGRVDLDADWNEYVEIQDYLDRTQKKDIIGPCGAPKTGGGFEIRPHRLVSSLLTEVHFANKSRGWAVGEEGKILTTNDGGNTWSLQTSEVDTHLYGVYFINDLKGWAVGFNGTILNTDNGGENWILQTSGVEERLYGVFFLNESKGWAVGSRDTILTTNDGGNHWTPSPSGVNAYLQEVYFVNDTDGWAAGTISSNGDLQVCILVTRDGGVNWELKLGDLRRNLYGMFFTNTTNGWVVGSHGYILMTENGGNDWKSQESGSNVSLYGVHFINESRGWIVGDEGTILATEDGGANWLKQSSMVEEALMGVHFVDESKGCIVGAQGNILTTDNGGKSWSLWKPPITDLNVSSGRIYVDGILCELEREAAYLNQPDYPNPAPLEPTEGRTDLVYLDVWQRHITAIEDPDIREVALGGPDTASRIKTIAQVKILPDVGDVLCSGDIKKWNEMITPGGGRLKTKAQVGTEPEHPCPVAESGGYSELENRLYRVEIHEGGDLGKATFKWSRDNGSTVYEIVEFIEDETDPTKIFKVKLKQIGRDEILKIKKNDWLEITGDQTDLEAESAGTIAKVKVDEAERILTLSKDVASHKDEAHPKVRRWDTGEDTVTPPTETAEGPIKLEDGIEIYFSGSNFKVGDYWIFSARISTGTGKIEELDYELPQGIKHHYCKLALVKWKADGTAEIEDCRKEFPSLTEISKAGGCCTVTVGEDGDFTDIQAAVDALEGGPGMVCILPGIYVIDEPLSIEGWGITIIGCEGTSIILNRAESRENGTVFIIQNSWGIRIRSLWAITFKGDRAVDCVNSHIVQISECAMVATGFSDDSGTIVFQGTILGCVVEKNLIAGICGIRFRGFPESKINLHAAVRIQQNAIFGLQTAILQTSQAIFIGLDVVDNMLLGFGISSLFKEYFPASFVEFAEKNVMYDPETINRAKKVRREEFGFESATAPNITPIVQFINHLQAEKAVANAKFESMEAVVVTTAAPVMDLRGFAWGANIHDNTILGRSGIHAADLLEYSMAQNVIMVSETGVSLRNFEGVTIDDNVLYTGGSGIQCLGLLVMNLTVSNNRVVSGVCGIEFMVPENFQVIVNAQISQNFINATGSGIKVNDPATIVYDFTAFDNSIIGCNEFGIILSGLDENQFLTEDIASFQRVIQRNSIQISGVGVRIEVSNTKIVDNDITIMLWEGLQKPSYGIMIFNENCTVVNNSICGKIKSRGGIYISLLPSNTEYPRIKMVIINSNRISGGTGNGIEIASDLDGGIIDNNFITNMNLNGIAVDEGVISTDNLAITNNKILRCSLLDRAETRWWKYAGIVLTRGEKIQIIGNEICENGRNIADPNIQVGGIYAERLHSATIANNHSVDNGPNQPPQARPQAVIHIPGIAWRDHNEGVRIVANLVKSSNAPALLLGTWYIVNGNCNANDIRTIITSNHFESEVTEPVVQLQSNYCIFSNNYIVCSDEEAVDLGCGWYVTALGNVTSGQISGDGMFLEIQHNVVF